MRTREKLRKQLATIRELRRFARVQEDGVPMPPTVANCVHTPGMKGCPLVAESTATQRFLVECGTLYYDLPRHVYAPHDHAETPWSNTTLTDAQRQALIEVERGFREHFESLFEAAYVSAVGKSRGELPYGDAFREILHSEQGKSEKWGAVQGPHVLLGELDRAEFEGLPPVARLYAEMSLAGDTYEAELATVLGATEARRLHKAEDGWGFSGVALGHDSPPAKCNETDYPEGY